MLIKWMTAGPDYGKTLRRRRLIAVALLCVAAVGFLCYVLLVPHSGLDD